MNPILALNYETALESLGADYYDDVAAAEFPQQILRFRNDDLLIQLGLDPAGVSDEHFVEAFGKFANPAQPFLALRYHGYQFGEYNPGLGDGRGFLYGQVRDINEELYDFGTKGSGRTPYSRGGDGMLTLKGGVREVLAAEALHQMSVRTSRCLSMVETGLDLWRGDEPSPTRSSVMVRFSRSHIRFGTFERLNYLKRPDLIEKLLDHVIAYYYGHLSRFDRAESYLRFYTELVRRVAELVAQWMAVGFCHAVLNTDNMSITGESFDYGPYAFLPTYNPEFTAAYFDHYGRYSYANQPGICKLNLELLQQPLSAVIDTAEMTSALAKFEEYYFPHYKHLMLCKLGLDGDATPVRDELLVATLQLLADTQVGYHQFFYDLSQAFKLRWQQDLNSILNETELMPEVIGNNGYQKWLQLYHQALSDLSPAEFDSVEKILTRSNPQTILLRPQIEAIWEPIAQANDWEPFEALLAKIRSGK
ncbi:protein adenylyltransferase SelO family protein [Chamaesiphon sp. OTE_75_metabat_556]|uniref:protein adenylyltransferase SelO n=1 Tax=Chamaesiphon sp. OTE_75_metabat_556 TaxID=2964692 RepID=UPI00286AC92E|nr:YdiU family protein [Chamaesiphon sp. OTE_75_metabat_556]